ncbi:class III extradiol ring-cleavage dioxygenase [Thalassospiraceae bacterium LMO-JJ14]|nr:class III extradiol ring-cleavage dioxygenase [Thalassospiraceae bacterium LMO-JJ14]
MPIPALFVSHGAPTVILDESPVRTFLTKLAETVETPDAILAVSAHWETETPMLSDAANPETIYDFYGFPGAMYQLSYPAPGAPELAEKTRKLLVDNDLGPVDMAERGLDHGAWVPLMLGWPKADIPVTQLSIQPHKDPSWHYRMGEALRPLRDDNVLILASGNLTHNLQEFRGHTLDSEPEPWARAFDEWAGWAICEGRTEDLLDYRRLAPEAVRNHPTDEHLLPLFVAMGAGSPGQSGRHLHKSYTYGVLAMDAFAFS